MGEKIIDVPFNLSFSRAKKSVEDKEHESEEDDFIEPDEILLKEENEKEEGKGKGN